nr:hypothetical protein [Acidipropionibacterium jensenii]
MSPTHLRPGACAVKSRSTRSGRSATSSAGIVVRTLVCGWAATRWWSRMIARTVVGWATSPAWASAAVIRR